MCKIGEHLRLKVFQKNGATSCPAPLLAGVKLSALDCVSHVRSPERAGGSEVCCWGMLPGMGLGLWGCSLETGPILVSSAGTPRQGRKPCPVWGCQQRNPACSFRSLSPALLLPCLSWVSALKTKSVVSLRDLRCLSPRALLAPLRRVFVGCVPVCAASRSP